jgi:hypothetical protein
LDPEKAHLGLSWVEHLQKTHEVENFARGGTGFRWSYELYLENQHKFDYNIVVVSDPGRLWIKSLDSHPKVPNIHFFNQDRFRHNLKDAVGRNDELFGILDAIQIWMHKCRDEQWELHLHNLMVKNIVQNYSNTLLIPGFINSIEGYEGNLTDIQSWEILQLDPDFYADTIDCKRKCHLTEENNEILFNLVVDAINKKEKILNLNIIFFKKPTKNIDFYIEWS